MSKKEKVPQLTPEEADRRIAEIINEAQFRFKCCEIAKDFSDTHEEMFTIANDIYQYAFHIKKS
jgi:hypothetical protein|tara:strand:+ start:1022 stop:1213 length:192 start_codon:yes stop_codon:yes gene_type:complete